MQASCVSPMAYIHIYIWLGLGFTVRYSALGLGFDHLELMSLPRRTQAKAPPSKLPMVNHTVDPTRHKIIPRPVKCHEYGLRA